ANGMGRATSPLAGGSATSLNGNHVVSPTHGGSCVGSPMSPTNPSAVNGANGSAKSNVKKWNMSNNSNAKPKQWKPLPPLPEGAALDDHTPYLTDDEKKHRFTTLVKEVAQLKDVVLILRPAYQSIHVPSPSQKNMSAA
ncbi:hypothetical protein FOMPIDRAFT_94103, partial [Fomitopsis schrenkii]